MYLKLYSNEIVFRGHPDKVCDQIAGAILNTYLEKDKDTRAGIEVCGGKKKIFITGEITSRYLMRKGEVKRIVKRVLKDVGYSTKYKIIVNFSEQSYDIARGVDVGGAGDQGMMFGYACDDTEELLPTAQVILQEFSKWYDDLRKTFPNYYYPDGKAQITGWYDNQMKLHKIKTFLVSYQNPYHSAEEREKTLDKRIIDEIVYLCKKHNVLLARNAILINPTGSFVKGGFEADSGLTGRKIVVDAYQSFANVGGGCVDADTEYLTPYGWKKIKDFNDKHLVGQWNNGKLEFVEPINFIKLPAEKMYHFKTTQNVDMVLSENHNFLYRTSKGNYQKKTVNEILKEYERPQGSRAEIPLFFNYDFDEQGSNLSDKEIKLQVAICADGTLLPMNKKWNCRIRVKKHYKIKALRELLKYKDYLETKHNEFSIFWLKAPIYSKDLCECFPKLTKRQASIIVEEVLKWDGDKKSKFRTTRKNDADFIQFLYMGVYGRVASILTNDRVGESFNEKYTRKSISYLVQYKKEKYSNCLRKKLARYSKLEITEENHDLMYCINVPSHNLVLRRNNRVFITGNCMNGKDPSKVDFSAAHKARQLAIRYLKSEKLTWCEVQISYAIGKPLPVAIYICHNRGNSQPTKEVYEECEPLRIIADLNLKNADFEELAKFGHFTSNKVIARDRIIRD